MPWRPRGVSPRESHGTNPSQQTRVSKLLKLLELLELPGFNAAFPKMITRTILLSLMLAAAILPGKSQGVSAEKAGRKQESHERGQVLGLCTAYLDAVAKGERDRLPDLFDREILYFGKHMRPLLATVAADLERYWAKWPHRQFTPDIFSAQIIRNAEGTRLDVTLPYHWQVNNGRKSRSGKSLLKAIVILRSPGEPQGYNNYAIKAVSEQRAK
jgi:hypothetical protein